MNENQMNFLNELDKLLAKYSISRVHTIHEGGGIVFESNGQSLAIASYDGDAFEGISSFIDEYQPPT